MADIGSALTDSLSRSGQGSMTAPFKSVDGSEALPGLTFSSEVSSGWYRAAAGDLRFSVLGEDAIRLRNNTNPLQIWDGAQFVTMYPYDPSAVTITGTLTMDDGGGATGSWVASTGVLTTEEVIITATPDIADILTGEAGVPITCEALVDVVSPVASSVTGTADLDLSVAGSFRLTLTGNTTLNLPTNGIPGMTYSVEVLGDSGTNRTLTFASGYMGQGSLIGINNTTPFLITLYCRDSTHYYVGIIQGDLS